MGFFLCSLRESSGLRTEEGNSFSVSLLCLVVIWLLLQWCNTHRTVMLRCSCAPCVVNLAATTVHHSDLCGYLWPLSKCFALAIVLCWGMVHSLTDYCSCNIHLCFSCWWSSTLTLRLDQKLYYSICKKWASNDQISFYYYSQCEWASVHIKYHIHAEFHVIINKWMQ